MSIIRRSTPPAELSVDNQLSALMTPSVPRILYGVQKKLQGGGG